MADPYHTGIRVQQAQSAVLSVHWPRRDPGQEYEYKPSRFLVLNITDLLISITFWLRAVRIQTGNSCGTMWRKTKWFSNLTFLFSNACTPPQTISPTWYFVTSPKGRRFSSYADASYGNCFCRPCQDCSPPSVGPKHWSLWCLVGTIDCFSAQPPRSDGGCLGDVLWT